MWGYVNLPDLGYWKFTVQLTLRKLESWGYPPCEDRVIRREARIFVRGGHDDGGTEGPERGAKRRSAEGVGPGEGRRSPLPSMGV